MRPADVATAWRLAVDAPGGDPSRLYYGTDTRAASLLVGAGLAVVLAGGRGGSVVLTPGRGRAALGVLSGVAVLVLGYAVSRADGGDAWLYRGGLLLVALAVAVVLAHVVLVPNAWSARALCWSPLVFVGRISYGVYLWHWPVFVAVNAARTGRTGLDLLALRCVVTLALATASYVLVERPVRQWGSGRRSSAATGATLAGVAAALALVTLAPTGGVLARAVDEPAYPHEARDGLTAVGPALAHDGRNRARPSHRVRTARHEHPIPGREPVVDVFGDSIAWSLVTSLPDQPGLDIRDRTMLGCGIARAGPYRYFGQLYPSVSRDCSRWPELWSRAIGADDPDVALIVVGRWETMDRQLEGRWSHVGDRDFDAYLRAELERAIRTAGAHGARVLLATEPYNRRGEQPDGTLWPEDEPERVTAWNALLRDVAAEHRRVGVVDLGRRLTPDGEFTWTAGGYQVRYDGVHLTPSGVQGWVAPWLLPQLRGAVGPPEH